MISKGKIYIKLFVSILILTCTGKVVFAQSYQYSTTAVQAAIYPYYKQKGEYTSNKHHAFSLGFLKYRSDYTRTVAALFYSEKSIATDMYRSSVKDYIASYGYGMSLVDVLQQFFRVFADIGALGGYKSVSNYSYTASNISSPFKSGFVIGIYTQLNAELSVFRWLVLFARIQVSYNGPIVYDQWSLYQGLGARIVFK